MFTFVFVNLDLCLQHSLSQMFKYEIPHRKKIRIVDKKNARAEINALFGVDNAQN